MNQSSNRSIKSQDGNNPKMIDEANIPVSS